MPGYDYFTLPELPVKEVPTLFPQRERVTVSRCTVSRSNNSFRSFAHNLQVTSLPDGCPTELGREVVWDLTTRIFRRIMSKKFGSTIYLTDPNFGDRLLWALDATGKEMTGDHSSLISKIVEKQEQG